MSKTPEQLAEEHAKLRCPEQGPEFIVWCMCRDDFLAGYKAGCTNTQSELAVGREVVEFLLEKPQWISVKERLPEYDQLVLIWHPDFEKPFVGSRVDSGLMDPLYWWRCEFDMYEPEGIITHWMPLPEPPEEEK